MGKAKARVKGHALTWMGGCRALCACGTAFTVTEQQAVGRSKRSIDDELMDRHTVHIKMVRMNRQDRMRREVEE